MQGARNALLTVSFICALLCVGVELGTSFLPGDAPNEAQVKRTLQAALPDSPDIEQLVQRAVEKGAPPGQGLRGLALLDGVLLFNVGILFAGLWLHDRVYAKTQGVVTLAFMLITLLGGLAFLLLTIALLLLMVGLFLAVPFGTLAYFAGWGFFDVGSAAVALSLGFVLKLIAVVGALLSQPEFLRMKGFMALGATSLVGSLLISFLQGEFPLPLVSMTDALGAIIVVILALVWAFVQLLGSISSVLKALRT
jgi:hypothetical protein